MFANLNETIFLKKVVKHASGLGMTYAWNEICMQNMIKIYYVVKSYEHFHELLTDGRADEPK